MPVIFGREHPLDHPAAAPWLRVGVVGAPPLHQQREQDRRQEHVASGRGNVRHQRQLRGHPEPWPRCSAHAGGIGLTGCRLEMPPIRLLAAERCDRLVANRCAPRLVYGRLLPPSTCRSAHGRRGHRVSRAKPTPPKRSPRGVPSLRAASAREDAAPQGRLREPRKLAQVARSRRAARAGIRRGRTPQLSRVRAPLLRLRPRSLHDVPHGVGRGLLLQGPRRLPVLQRPPHGPDGRASCRSRHPAGARAAVGDLRAQAIARSSSRTPPCWASAPWHLRL